MPNAQSARDDAGNAATSLYIANRVEQADSELSSMSLEVIYSPDSASELICLGS